MKDVKKLIEQDLHFQEIADQTEAFCPLPWSHLHVSATGAALPCCIADWKTPVGNIAEQSFDEIWQGEEIRELRKKLLNDEKVPHCAACYSKEKSGDWSLRIDSLRKFHKSSRDWVLETDQDGRSENAKPIYWDIRFSNICNMRCRMCGHFSSSRWFADAKKLRTEHDNHRYSIGGEANNQTVIRATPDSIALLDRLEEYLPYVEEIYFAGGEPLIMDEHYRILEFLDRNKLYDVYIRYSTNLLTLDYKRTPVTEVWKKFNNVECVASVDTFGARAENIRADTKWEKIIENAELIRDTAPNVTFRISPTVQIMNIFTVTDMHLDWIKRDLIGPNDCFYNILENPDFYNIKALPPELKAQATEKWESYYDALEAQFSAKNLRPIKRTADNVLQFMNSEQMSDDHLHELVNQTRMLDRIRNEDTQSVFPELKLIWDRYS